jgi:tetratricopeptide (TPR) repeat protein
MVAEYLPTRSLFDHRALALFLAVAALLFAPGCKGSSSEAFRLLEEGKRALLIQGDRRQAELLLRKALEIEPRLTQARMVLVQIYEQEGPSSREKLLRELREVLRIAPNHIFAHYRLALAHLWGGELEEAFQELEKTQELLKGPLNLGLDGVWAPLLAYKAFLLLEKGQFDAAQEALRQAYSLKPSDPRVLLGLVVASARRADWDALEGYASGFSKQVEPGRGRALEGLIAIWKGEPQRAADIFERVLAESSSLPSKSPQRRTYERFLAWALWEAGQGSKAREIFPDGPEGLEPSPVEILFFFYGRPR